MFDFRFDLSDLVRLVSQLRTSTVGTASTQPIETVSMSEADPYDVEWIDLRTERATKSRGRSKGSRSWSQVTGITLHQPAVWVTDPMSTLNWPVHASVLPGEHEFACKIVIRHDPTSVLWHGHGFNKRDIGIEVVARACGIEGDPRTLWLPKKYSELKGAARLAKAREATRGQLEGTRRLIERYRDDVAAHNGELAYIHAHRQSHKSRVSDPGSRIWNACGEWAIEELGMSAGPGDFAVGSGKPLPDAWTGRPNGQRYNWRVDGRIG